MRFLSRFIPLSALLACELVAGRASAESGAEEVPPPVFPMPVAAKPVIDPAAAEAARLKRHQSVARTRAERYFRYEQPLGSGSLKVTTLKLELGPAKPVAGNPRRAEISG